MPFELYLTGGVEENCTLTHKALLAKQLQSLHSGTTPFKVKCCIDDFCGDLSAALAFRVY